MDRGCKRPECTVADTGKCVLNRDPNSCAERLVAADAAAPTGAPIEAAVSPLPRPLENPKLPNSQVLDLDQARAFAAAPRTNLIGVLGSPASGKTAALVSMYLLLAHNKLDGFSFAYSDTLMALDQISRGARRWSAGNKPEQLTDRTTNSADRGPGFMHLRLRNLKGQTNDLLIPDLPGEWTDTLVDDNRTDHWTWLQSADVLCIFVDGRQLATQRQYTTHRTKVLIQRAAALVAPRKPPVVLAVSHRDALAPSEATIRQFADEAARYGLGCSVIPIASFTSNRTNVSAGHGIAELVASWVNPPSPPSQHFWPDTGQPQGDRAMLRFRFRDGS